ncbi:MAG: hypothetical protein JRL30_28555, partial [Deltaproteobacteria bacterium]|nr:hypothetical protein [Deltaproteobacteria bacterium]
FKRKRCNAHGPLRVRVYAHHGYGGGRLTGSKLNKVMALHQIADAEIYMMGHLHDTAFTPKTKFDITAKGQLIERDIIYALVGAHLRTYVQSPGQVYGEEKAYTPTPHGLEKITISFQTRQGVEIPRCAYSWVPL